LSKTAKRFIYISSIYTTRPNSFKAYLFNEFENDILKYKLNIENLLRISGLNYCIIKPGKILGK